MTVPSIPEGQDIDRKKQIYRDINNVYYESGLISVLILSQGNHQVFKRCFQTTVDSLRNYKGSLEYIFLEQAWDTDPESACRNVQFFNEVTKHIDRTLIVLPSRNGGINYGINQLWQLARGEYILFLENDWICSHPGEKWLECGKIILDQHKDIGILQVRAIGDPSENWGAGKPEFSPWSCDGKPGVENRTIGFDGRFLKFYVTKEKMCGVNNNPALWRKTMREDLGPMSEPELWSDLRHGETSYQNDFMNTQWNTAHIRIPIYYHCPLYMRSKEA